ncbi:MULTISPECIES: ABC transporter ATP-binding protein [Ruminococcus]|uniref:ABC transporter, ATP-binding protein n=1 Tax=Ruminococcus albus 8 TaxID=246199 RepID=E9SAR7_RUMAL|nr:MULTISPECIES: ABC transporter ATP-binding protein [Ruminococcus]EGC03502.1 ABC transporter, ATP-binding protein [Ruminococcus albus 8]MBR0529132.1 ABC transporter ATP-binding protein [Ruminococcus sp.]MCC3349888.1 ABC transporter ATP-binding protein [Ruminococcus albus 8]
MTNAIEIRGLVKEYKDFRLNSVDLTLPGGCILGLIGENGAGKSTLIKCLLGVILKNEGSIKILGRDADTELADIKEDIGVVMDEVGIPDSFRYKHINAVMKNTFRNWDEKLFESYMDKFKLPRDKKFKEFSRGMKMKMGIAIALSHNAKLLVLDEATNGLDPVIRDEVTDIFYEFTRDEEHSILISSHIVSDLEKLCDYVSFIHKGQVLLNEEKDVLLEEYAIAHTTEEELKELDPSAIRGRKSGKYGVQVLVRRDAVPAGMKLSPVTIEELFIFMIKEID